MSNTANQPTAELVALLNQLGAITPQKPMRLMLEPRVVFDAAGVALAADAVDVPDAATAADATSLEADAAATHAGLVEALQSSEPASEAASIVFIDAGVTDAETLANAAQPDSEVVFLTADRDGMEQIAQYLEGRSGIGAVHILSHGDTGEVRLGDSALTTASIAGDHADELAVIKAALSADADILIYGCDVSNGASGEAFVNALAAATGADIAASTDDTGAADKGGDWDLETSVGTIEAQALEAADFKGILVDTDGDGLDDADDLDDDNDGILDTVEDGPTASAGLFSTIGAPGSNVVDGSSYPITPDTTITYDLAINSGSGTVRTYDAGADGDALRLQASGSSSFAGELDLTFSSSVRNVSFALTDFDNLETYTVNIYDPDGNLYDLSSAGVTSIGTNLLQTGNTFAEQFDSGNSNGDSPSDPFGSVYFNIAGLVSRIEIDFTHSKASSSIRLLEPTFTVVYDTDSDGIIDSLDLDSDNDGISDLVESGQDAATVDTNNDGIVDGPVNIVTGIAAAAAGGVTPIDSDGDGLTDQLDLDSDNDGIADTIEARPTAGYVANDGNVTDNDADGDGVIDIFDANDGTGTFGGTFAAPEDTDGDGTADYLDTDSDDDGLLDAAESGLTPGADTNGDGIGDGTGASYADPDGIVNNPQTALANQTGNTTEVGYRELPNDPPVLVDPDPTAGTPSIDPLDPNNLLVPATDNVALTLDLTPYYEDPESDALTITPDPADIPAWLTFNPLTNTFTGTPPSDNTGDVVIDVTVNDGINPPYASTVTIQPVNPPPVAVTDTVNTTENTPVGVDLLANDTDPDGDPLTVVTATLADPTQGTLTQDPVTLAWTSTPATGFNGTATVNYTIQDQDGAQSTSTHDIVVAPNDPPVLTDPVPGDPATPEIDPLDPNNLLVPATDNVALTLDLTPYYEDPESDALTITPDPADIPAWLTFNPLTNTFTGTPPVDNVGDVVIDVAVDDGINPPYASTVTIQPVNPPPVAVTDTVNTTEATPVVVDLLANDIDPDGDPLTVVTATLADPTQGTLTQDPVTLEWTFTPATSFNGTATVNYTIQDQDGAQSTSTHDIVVAPNDPPVLTDPVPGDPTTPEIDPLDPNNLLVPATDNVALTLDLTPYYEDPESDALTITPDPADIPAWLTFNPLTNTFTGTPPSDNTGDVVIDVTVNDGINPPYASTVTIQPVNPAPVATPETESTPENTQLTGNVLDNETDPDGDPLTVTAASVDVDGSGAPVALVLGTPTPLTDTAGDPIGTITLNTDGSYTFDPETGYNGPVPTVTYTATDIDGESADTTLDITVTPVNDVPVDPDDVNTVTEDTTLTVDAASGLLNGATDGDGDTLTITDFTIAGVAGTQVPGAPVAIPGVGDLTINADGSYAFTPVANYTGPIPVATYTVSDGIATDTSTLTLTMVPVNDVPLATDGLFQTNEDVPVNGNAITEDAGSGVDNDVDGDTLTLVAGSVGTFTTTEGGSITIAGDGTFTYTPGLNFNGLDTFDYTITDGNGGFDTATLFFQIPPVNDPPVDPDDTNTVTEDVTLTVDAASGLLTGATDPEGDALSISSFTIAGEAGPFVVGAPYNLAGVGTLTLNADGSYAFTPVANYNGPIPVVTYTITDGNGGTDTSTLTLTMVPVNDPPVDGDETNTTAENTPLLVNAAGGLLANATDVDGDVLTVTEYTVNGTTFTAGTSATLPGVGVLTINADGSYGFIPETNYAGPVPQATYTISDGQDTDTSTLDITVTPNEPPVLVDPVPGDPATPEIDPGDPNNLLVPSTDDVPLTLDLTPYYEDPEGDTLTVTPDPAAIPSWLTFDPLTNTFTGTPPVDNTGDVVIPITVDDGVNPPYASTITIQPVNPPPVAVTDTVNTMENVPVLVDLLANDTDPDGDPLTVISATLADATQGTLTQDPVTLAWTFTPATGFNGTATVNYTIQDQDGALASSTHDIVVAPNEPPVLVDPVPGDPATPEIDPGDPNNLLVPATDNVALTLDLTPYYEDPETDTLTITPNPAAIPSWLTFDPLTNTFTGTPPVDNTGDVVIPITVNDGINPPYASTITIQPVNPPPVAVTDTVNTTENTPVGVDLLANDTDPDGDPLTVVTATLADPTQGTLVQDPVTLAWTFTPTTGFNGTATVNYTIEDQDGLQSTSTHDIVVTPNEPPALTDPLPGDPATPEIDPGDPNNLIVPSTDGTPGTLPLTDYFTDPESDNLTITPDLSGVPPTWTVSHDPLTGVLSYTPPVDNNGPITIPVSVDDGINPPYTSTVTLDPANPPPVAVTDSVGTTENTPVVVDLLANDTDPDGDPLTVVTATLADPTQGTLTQDPVTLEWTFTPTDGLNGLVVIDYTIEDQDGAQATSTHEVRIPPNDPPVLVDPNPGVPGTPEINSGNPNDLRVPATDNVPLTLDLTDYYEDPEGDPLTITPDPADIPSWLTFDPATNTFTGTPPADNTGEVVIKVDVDDGVNPPYASTITIQPRNPLPVATPEVETTLEDTPLTGNVLDNEVDPDGDPIAVTSASTDVDGSGNLTALVLGAPTPLTNAAGDPIGTLTLNTDGSYVFEPAPDYNGPVPQVSYTLNDIDGGKAETTLDITITPVNDPPVAVDDVFTTPEDTPVVVDLISNDTDVDGDPLTIQSINGTPLTPGTPQVIAVPNGTVEVSAAGDITFTPDPDYNGPVTFDYVVADPDGLTDVGTVNIDVTPVNDPPVAIDDGLFETTEGLGVTVDVLTNDYDVDGDPLTVTAASSPDGKVTINPDGTIVFEAVPGFVGTTIVTYTITDGNGGFATASLQVKVNPAVTPFHVDDPRPPQAVRATVAELIEVDGDILETSTDIRRLFEIDEMNRIERTSSDSLDLVTLSGFSLKFGDGAWRAHADDGAGVKIESLITKGVLLLQLERIGSDRDVEIRDYVVRTRDGQPVPGWLERPQADLLQGRVPSDVEVLELVVEAHLSDGRILSQQVRVWTMTGEIKSLPDNRAGLDAGEGFEEEAANSWSSKAIGKLAKALDFSSFTTR